MDSGYRKGEGDARGSYSKRPLWQWVVIYVVIGGIVYAAIYYFAFYGKGGYRQSGGNNNPINQYNNQPSPSTSPQPPQSY